jgi:hypothetical protein
MDKRQAASAFFQGYMGFRRPVVLLFNQRNPANPFANPFGNFLWNFAVVGGQLLVDDRYKTTLGIMLKHGIIKP